MDRHLKHPGSQTAGAILFFFILLFLYTKLAGPIPFTVNNINTEKTAPFSVDGQGSASDVPDEATISFGVTKNSSSVSDAQNQTNNSINAILEKLRQLGISDKDLKTTNYSVNPNYNFEGTQKITGYNVTQNIELKLKDIKNANKAIDTITGSGANLVGQIQFGFSQGAKEKLEEKARKEAVGNAKQKAQSIAKVTGVRLGKIINIQESSDNFPVPMALDVSRKTEEGTAQTTEITPGENSIKINITLTYEIN